MSPNSRHRAHLWEVDACATEFRRPRYGLLQMRLRTRFPSADYRPCLRGPVLSELPKGLSQNISLPTGECGARAGLSKAATLLGLRGSSSTRLSPLLFLGLADQCRLSVERILLGTSLLFQLAFALDETDRTKDERYYRGAHYSILIMKTSSWSANPNRSMLLRFSRVPFWSPTVTSVPAP